MEINKLDIKNQTEFYLNNVIKNSKLSHAYLFVNSSKEILSKYILKFVKSIFCEENNFQGYYNCDKCKKCLQINNNNYVDFYEIESENTIKKDNILFLKKEMQLKPTYTKKIYWLKDVDKLTSQAANSILKILEEPEDDIIAIMSTTSQDSVIDTIISRCQVINIKENISLENKIESENYSKVISTIENFIADYAVNKNFSLINILENLKSKEDIITFFEILKDNFKKYGFNNSVNINDYYFVYSNVMTATENLEFNVSPQLVLESFLIKLVMNDTSIDFLKNMLKDNGYVRK